MKDQIYIYKVQAETLKNMSRRKTFAFIRIKDAQKSIWEFSLDAFEWRDVKEKVDEEREDIQMMLDTKIEHK